MILAAQVEGVAATSFWQGVTLIVMSAIITLALDVLRRWIYRKIDQSEEERDGDEPD